MGTIPLPPLVIVADSGACVGRPLLTVLEAAVAGGARAIWLRDRQSPPDIRRQLAIRLADLLHDIDGVLVASPGPGSEVADGLQLGTADPGPGPVPAGRSAHSREELDRAAAEGCRWATLSPIFASASKPGYGPPLGLPALAGAPLPVWALGGLDHTNAAACVEAGAAGVAVMGAVLGAPDPADATARILEVVA